MNGSRIVKLALFGMVALGGRETVFADATYSLTTINIPGATENNPQGINNSGQIVGWFVDSQAVGHGFVDTGGSFTTFNVPGATNTDLVGIKDSGQIVGGRADLYIGYLIKHDLPPRLEASAPGCPFLTGTTVRFKLPVAPESRYLPRAAVECRLQDSWPSSTGQRTQVTQVNPGVSIRVRRAWCRIAERTCMENARRDDLVYVSFADYQDGNVRTDLRGELSSSDTAAIKCRRRFAPSGFMASSSMYCYPYIRRSSASAGTGSLAV